MTDSNTPAPDPDAQPTPPPAAPQGAPAGAPQAAAAAPLSQEQDVQWGAFAHLGGVVGFLPSLIIWLIFKDRGPFTNTEAKEALNFQITILIAYVVGSILTVILIGVFIVWAAWIVSVVFSIIAFLKAKDGQHYRYPFAIRLIK
ncbi:DUF4870 domain-containing protein [Agromyces cerinus]|uniref:DUF4870 domain-containing protein n=1 Tax=Agromyces cerinus subsp. cerinus TaxID=232089 RepID=A0A1N6E498_9MICO|nr:DUF4870 domain-containing protein [Agromyces cerinus]SIN77868.1 hypothetical protein SAMN05443544_1070 [Agromyces cerinus subsp. cerinus]